MTDHERYAPGPAGWAQIRKDGEKWTLILVRELRHSPEKVWLALTDPAHLREWAPFEVEGNLGTVGTVKLAWVSGAHRYGRTVRSDPQETTVTRADAPKVLEYNNTRWELEAFGDGTRLTLGHCRFISMRSPFKVTPRLDKDAAGWHICFDVLDHLLSGTPIGRIVFPEATRLGGWERLSAEYAKQFRDVGCQGLPGAGAREGQP